jgi:hypothetical protein
MSAIPLHLQRRLEGEMARFTLPASNARKNVEAKSRTINDESSRPAAKTKEKPAGINRGECGRKPLSQPVDFPRTFCPDSPSLRSSPWHPH